jgi:upstream activation factor subunit UAF30
MYYAVAGSPSHHGPVEAGHEANLHFDQLSRPQVVKKLWEHIKANDLQEPTDKRQIRCDEKLQAVFKQTTVNMFSMNKLLGSQLYPLDE